MRKSVLVLDLWLMVLLIFFSYLHFVDGFTTFSIFVIFLGTYLSFCGVNAFWLMRRALKKSGMKNFYDVSGNSGFQALGAITFIIGPIVYIFLVRKHLGTPIQKSPRGKFSLSSGENIAFAVMVVAALLVVFYISSISGI